MTFERYGVYYIPQGALGEAGASWLGWDIAKGQVPPPPELEGVDLGSVIEAPRRYGFHATIKPPFTLADGCALSTLRTAFEATCAKLAPVPLGGLALTWMGSFLTLTATGDTSVLETRAAQMVRALDPFRAPLTPTELARRNPARLTEKQLHNLQQWGYPYVMESFRFHITLTGRLPRRQRSPVERAAVAHLAPHLPSSLSLEHLSLVGQGADGLFRELHRAPLGG